MCRVLATSAQDDGVALLLVSTCAVGLADRRSAEFSQPSGRTVVTMLATEIALPSQQQSGPSMATRDAAFDLLGDFAAPLDGDKQRPVADPFNASSLVSPAEDASNAESAVLPAATAEILGDLVELGGPFMAGDASATSQGQLLAGVGGDDQLLNSSPTTTSPAAAAGTASNNFDLLFDVQPPNAQEQHVEGCSTEAAAHEVSNPFLTGQQQGEALAGDSKEAVHPEIASGGTPQPATERDIGSAPNPFLATPQGSAALASPPAAELAGGTGECAESNPFLSTPGDSSSPQRHSGSTHEASVAPNPFLVSLDAASPDQQNGRRVSSASPAADASNPFLTGAARASPGVGADTDATADEAGDGGVCAADNPFLSGAAPLVTPSPAADPGDTEGGEVPGDWGPMESASDMQTNEAGSSGTTGDASNPFLQTPKPAEGPPAEHTHPDLLSPAPSAPLESSSAGASNPFSLDSSTPACGVMAESPRDHSEHTGAAAGAAGAGGEAGAAEEAWPESGPPACQQEHVTLPAARNGGAGVDVGHLDASYAAGPGESEPQPQHVVGLGLPDLADEDDRRVVQLAINRVAAAALRAGGALGCIPHDLAGGSRLGRPVGQSSSREGGSIRGTDAEAAAGGVARGSAGGSGGSSHDGAAADVACATLRDLEALLFRVQLRSAEVVAERDALMAENARIAGELVASKLASAAMQEELVMSRRELAREQQLLKEHIAWQASIAIQRMSSSSHATGNSSSAGGHGIGGGGGGLFGSRPSSAASARVHDHHSSSYDEGRGSGSHGQSGQQGIEGSAGVAPLHIGRAGGLPTSSRAPNLVSPR